MLYFLLAMGGIENPTAAEEGRSNSRKASIVSGIELNCGVVSSRETIVLSGGVF